MSSLTNFTVSVILLVSLPLEQFGIFSLVYVAYQLVVGAARSLVGEPLMVRHAGDPDAFDRGAAAPAVGLAALVGGIGTVICGLIASLAGGAMGRSLMILAVFLPALAVQDTWRFVFFSWYRPRLAFWNDLTWGGFQLALIFAVLTSGTVEVSLLVGVWAGTGAFAGVLGGFQAKVTPSIRSALTWLRNVSDLSFRFLAEFGANRGVSQLLLFAIAAIAGITAVGGLVGARTLFGPLNVLFLGFLSFGVPEAVLILRADSSRYMRFVRRSGLAMAGIALVWGIALLLLPSAMDVALVDEWETVRAFVAPVTIMVATEGWRQAVLVGLRGLGAARHSLRSQLIAAPIIVVSTLTGAFAFGGLGAAYGIAVGFLAGTAIWTLALIRAFRSAG